VPARLTDFAAGHEFPPTYLCLETEALRAYLDATGDSLPLYAQLGGAVPPLAVVALALGALLGQAELPPGSLHASEALECSRLVFEGETVECRTRLAQRSQRAGWLVSVVESELLAGGERALMARATVLSPAEAE
jgi:hypothetical protein